MNDFGPKRPMSESAETAPTDTAKAKRGRPKKKPDYDRENVRKKACTRLTCSRICDILESWETVALAALIIANLYTVSSRQQSKDRLRCEEEYNGLKYMKNIDKRKLIITLCTIVAIVAVGLGIFKMLQLVKEVEQVKDYNTESLRWAIIGAIGSWTGSVFGAIALVVSLVALWLPQRVKIAVGVSTGFILSQIPGIEKIDAYIITVKNTGIDRINNEYMPRLNLEIGRYINYSKLESMLSTQTLFFCNASRFDDEYEGEIPLEFFDGWAQQSEENYRRLNELKSHVYVPYVTCWTPYKTGNTKMWNEYASDNGVCIVSTVRQIFMLSRINGARMYKVHYLDENEQIGNMDVPFYIPHDDERARFGLPSSARVFHAIKKHDFKEENEIRSIIYKNSQEAGLQIPFNFKGFVSRVVLNPKSNDQQKEAIIELLNRYSYTTIVEE